MKSIFGIVLFSVTTALYAHSVDFKRVQFEHDRFRDYTKEELTERIGNDGALLPYYACNGRDELDPFQKPIRSNVAGNSLRIKAYKSDRLITYMKGRYFEQGGKEVTNLKDDAFYKHVEKALKKLEKLESTSKLLRMLEESHYPLTIEFGGNRFVPYADEQPYRGIYIAGAISFFDTLRFTSEDSVTFNQIGTGGAIAWHPTMKLDTVEADGEVRVLDPDIALAHEMYHAFDSIRGLLDQRGVQGENYEFTSVTEYRASYFENLVRAELGVRYRKYYGEKTGPGILDQDGEPIYITSPCLQ